MAISRQRILAYLKKNRAASAREIARGLKMSAPNVRHHLSVLTSDRRVELSAVNNRAGRGRPEKIYSLAQTALGDNFTALADALLLESGSRLKIEALAAHLMDSSEFANLSTVKKLNVLVEKLNGMHYQSRWEAGAEGPRVILGRCPYARVISKHPLLCKMDTAMLSGALGRPVERLSKAESAAQGACPFVFIVR